MFLGVTYEIAAARAQELRAEAQRVRLVRSIRRSRGPDAAPPSRQRYGRRLESSVSPVDPGVTRPVS